ncbi:MAG: response regulator, partial [Candidatus Riflebacteria bacterium]|nr:response regulator [Candidatus Riflebacteria bacterium]
TFWNSKRANVDTEKAVNSVSLLYLEELAGRRAQVVSSSLNYYLEKIHTAISLLESDDLMSVENLQRYQDRMKKLYSLEKFAFVDTEGVVYTSSGPQTDIEQYPFDYKTLKRDKILIKDVSKKDKKVIIAVPLDSMRVADKELKICFIEIAMTNMIDMVSLQTDNNKTTFCNIYTQKGVALTNLVLGGLAQEDNLLDAMKNASYDSDISYLNFEKRFTKGKDGVISFTYNNIKETLYYEPIPNTDWVLTYLIRESVLNNQISNISDSILVRSLIQAISATIILIIMFGVIIVQNRKKAKLEFEKEKIDSENKIKQEELEQRLSIQQQLLEQEKQKTQADYMITALSSDYRSVYYVDLKEDEAVCIRSDIKLAGRVVDGNPFPYMAKVTEYANAHVAESYREGFLDFIKPENIREKLMCEQVISFRYLAIHDGIEAYEMLKMARVRHSKVDEENEIQLIGVGFTDIDAEMRDSLQKSKTLSEALKTAEEASKAKTIFLSNMSHEIRTPMNAIIGLDSIALHDPDISDKTRDILEKIGTSAQHLLSLINDILDMSRIESGRMVIRNEEFLFSKLIEQINTIFSSQCREKEIEYDCRLEGNIADYYIGDNTKLRQVLINILGNAVKFTNKGGKVSLLISNTASFNGKSTFKFVIKDTGIGISKEFLPKIFESFTQEDSSLTNKYGSSGLGMAITKSIVKLMNGDIDVESEKGVGTTFTVTVTLLDSKRNSANEKAEEIRLQDLSVLLVDDDKVASEHAKLVLEKVGIKSEIANSGREAIEMVKIRHARREPFNLIVVDWQMPDMDGIETTRQIRSIIANESAIIILTAYNWDDIIDEAIAAGVDSFIAKPLFASNLLDEFKEAVKKKKIKTAISNKVDLKGKRILLAEDMQINAEIMIMILKMRDMIVEHAVNGKVAVEMFESHEPGYYDAILMDMRMPEMDGLEATKKIRSLGHDDSKTIPIIALTANAFDEDVQRSLQAGLNAHLSKPVQPDVLLEILENMIPA